MQRILLTFITFLWITSSLYAQKKTKAPLSIYTFSALKSDNQDTASLNKRLNMGSFKFVFFDAHRRDQITSSLHFIEIGETTPEYVFDAYTNYHNNDFIKDFILENDPTRWNLHRRKNRMQPLSLDKE
jgi:hypothetical protein